MIKIDLGNDIATMRSISLPKVDKFRDNANRYQDISVVIGWVVNLLHTFAWVFDTPLRYEFKVLGSTSTIIDHIKVVDEKTVIDREFPLYLKSNKCSKFEWDRFLYGILLLNRNMVQLRHGLGKNTFDLRPILQNVAEIMALGKDSFSIQGIVNALPKTISLTLPPRSTCSFSIRDPNCLAEPTVSKSLTKVGKSMTKERIDGYCVEINEGYTSKADLQSHILRGDSLNQRQYNNDSDINKVASISSLDKLKSVASDVGEVTTSVQNTRSFSASSSSSYDTIETDRMSDNNTDATNNQSNVENKSNSHNLTKSVRNVANDNNWDFLKPENHNDDIELNAPMERDCTTNPFENSAVDQANKDIGSVDKEREQLNEENLNSLFWGDVTSRTSALSKPSSFQRPRTQH